MHGGGSAYLCIYLWLLWVFVAAHRPSLVGASGSYFLLQCVDSVVGVHGLHCSVKKQVEVSFAHSLGEGEGRPGALHGERGSLHDLPTPLGVLYAGTTLKTLLLLQHLRSSSWVFFAPVLAS